MPKTQLNKWRIPIQNTPHGLKHTFLVCNLVFITAAKSTPMYFRQFYLLNNLCLWQLRNVTAATICEEPTNILQKLLPHGPLSSSLLFSLGLYDATCTVFAMVSALWKRPTLCKGIQEWINHGNCWGWVGIGMLGAPTWKYRIVSSHSSLQEPCASIGKPIPMPCTLKHYKFLQCRACM